MVKLPAGNLTGDSTTLRCSLAAPWTARPLAGVFLPTVVYHKACAVFRSKRAVAANSRRGEAAPAGALGEVVSVPGEVQPDQKVQSSSRVPAQILEIPHKEGEQVTRYDQGAAGGAAAAATRPSDTQSAEAHGPATQPAEPPV